MTDLIEHHLTFDGGDQGSLYVDEADGSVLIDIDCEDGSADICLDAEQAKALATALKMWVLDTPEGPVMPNAQ